MKKSQNKKAAQNPRLLAVQALGEVLDEGKTLSECAALKDDESNRNLPQARHLAYGVLRWQVALAWLEAQLLSKALKQKDRDISRLLWLGLFQLWQDRTPDHAAINETTECARGLGKTWAVNMINAVLRRFQREQAELLERLAQNPEHLAHPSWLLAAIKKDWPDDWQAILQADNEAPPLWIRVNSQRASAESVSAQLTEAGFTCLGNESAPQALQISPAASVSELPALTKATFPYRMQLPNWPLACWMSCPACGYWTPVQLPAARPATCWSRLPIFS
jgi:16S rRNA (cytosine967-C5)-methyltransferase